MQGRFMQVSQRLRTPTSFAVRPKGTTNLHESAFRERGRSYMKSTRTRSRSLVRFWLLTAAIVAASSPATQPATAQDPQIQQRLAEVKESAARNKQALAQY